MSYLYPFKGVVIRALNINTLSGGNTLMTVTDAKKIFVVTAAMVECTAVSGFTTAPSISMGTNSSTYNDIAASQTTTISTLVRKGISLVSPGNSIAPGTSVFAVVTTPAVATTYTINLFLMGFYY